MPLIDLLRHGATDRKGFLLGRTDAKLSDEGWRQFEWQTAERGWSAVVTSPLRRSRDPAEKLARERNLSLQIDADWAELDFGDWDGRPLAELRADPIVAEQLDAFYRSPEAPGPPNGESWPALTTRVARALTRLVETPADSSLLVVTHAGPMRAAVALACGIPLQHTWALRIDPGSRITLRIEREDGRMWGEIVEIVQP